MYCFLPVATAVALSLSPPLIKDFFKSLNGACYPLQHSLQVLGVFVLMEYKECAQCSKRDLTRHDAAPLCCQLQVTLAFLVTLGH